MPRKDIPPRATAEKLTRRVRELQSETGGRAQLIDEDREEKPDDQTAALKKYAEAALLRKEYDELALQFDNILGDARADIMFHDRDFPVTVVVGEHCVTIHKPGTGPVNDYYISWAG